MPLDLPDNSVPDDVINQGLEQDLTPKEQKTENQVQDKVPYHEDPNVQAYIERQVAKRIGEGNQAWEDRLARLEQNLKKPVQTEAQVKIGDWTPATTSDAQAAKAIIAQAKQEMLEEMRQQSQAQIEQQQAEDQGFSEWLKELKTTSVLKDDEDAKEFANLIVRYKLEDKQAAVDLWNNLAEAKAQGTQQGQVQGMKRAQEAKIGSARTGKEPGQTGRSYKERRAMEPNFNAIVDREMTRMGY